MRGAVLITLTIVAYALFLVMLQGEGADAETGRNNTKLRDILLDRPRSLRDCILKCKKIACLYPSLTKKEVLECIWKCLDLFELF